MRTFSENAARRIRIAQLEHELEQMRESARLGRQLTMYLTWVAAAGWLAAILVTIFK